MADPSSNPQLTLPGPVCRDWAQSSRLEWLETNHTGAFAMGTVAGINTRRYHGLLIASLNPPADRYSVFSRVEETVQHDGRSFALATVQYPGTISPTGYELLESFSALPHATWTYRCGSLTLRKTIRLLEGQQAVVLSYVPSEDCELSIRLFVSFRDYHSLTRRNGAINPGVTNHSGSLSIQPYVSLPALTFHHNAVAFDDGGVWYENHEYTRELERGLAFQEDLYSPGSLRFDAKAGEESFIVAALDATKLHISTDEKTFADPLSRALDQFRVMRSGNKPTLIAGYPWFTDWSRDTLISLPALIAAGFDSGETRSILEYLLAERQQGILPNRFSDQASTPEYNTVDASLWFFIAAQTYINATNDKAFVKQTLFPAALDIIDWHTRGTFYDIHVDSSDSLLTAGISGTQLTWMDAKIGDYVVTPRIGKPVEINALWFNALQIASNWAAIAGDTDVSTNLLNRASIVKNSFITKFWNAERKCLYDVITSSGPDASVRPNQLFAISLPYPLLGTAQAKSIVDLVQQTLITPVGVRTLEPSDPNYRPRFDGDMRSRDSAYHQGTVWPWLIGPFIAAYLYAYECSPEAVDYCRQITDSAIKLMTECCIGSITEVFDAEPPYLPGGCPAQLWSVAQVILARQALKQS